MKKGGKEATYKVAITGFNPSKKGSLHGMHIHTTPDLGNKCNNTGVHFNPFNSKHGGPNGKHSER